MDAGAERLGERLLCGKAFRQIRGGLAMAAKALELGVDQDSLGKTLTEALERALDPSDVAQIRADSQDHVAFPSAPRRIASRYCRTASAKPSSSASAISACPMDTSSMPGTARRKAGRLSRLR